MILTGSRVYSTLGEDYQTVGWLANWNRRSAVPLVAIAIQGLTAVLLILSVGTPTGRGIVDGALGSLGVPPLPWEEYFGGFETLLAGSAPVFWMFFLLIGVTVFVFRVREPNAERPFAVPLYPLPPLVFCATSLYMVYASVSYAGWLVLIGIVPLAVGAVLLLVVRRADEKK